MERRHVSVVFLLSHTTVSRRGGGGGVERRLALISRHDKFTLTGEIFGPDEEEGAAGRNKSLIFNFPNE